MTYLTCNNLFSDRNGLNNRTIMVRKNISPEILNAIINCFSDFIDTTDNMLVGSRRVNMSFDDVDRFIHRYFLNLLDSDYRANATLHYLNSRHAPWNKKLDIIEAVIQYYKYGIESYPCNADLQPIVDSFIKDLNFNFERLNFGYRIVDGIFVEITSDLETKSIDDAIASLDNNISAHINKALKLCFDRENPDYSNSIKESISAVEAFCRDKTGCNDLGSSLNTMIKKNMPLEPLLKSAFDKLYAYTNQPTTGIRHSLMECSTKYTPTKAEAYYMVVTCSAFINYLRIKESQTH